MRLTAKSEPPRESDTAHVLSQLARAKAVFQQRTVVTHITNATAAPSDTAAARD